MEKSCMEHARRKILRSGSKCMFSVLVMFAECVVMSYFIVMFVECVVMSYFIVMSWKFSGETEDNHT
jgi:hypothetical protein